MKKLISILLTVAMAMTLFAGFASAQDSPLADARVRQALSYAIDMEAIVESFFEGKAELATSMTSPGEWLVDGLDPYAYDPDKARALLEEAGWPSDYTLDVVYYYSDQQTVDLMAIVQQYWSDVGVKAQFRKLEGDLNAQLWVPPADRVNGPSEIAWDMCYAAVAALVEHEFYDRFSSTAPNNSYFPKDDEVDAALAATNATADTAAQIEAFHNVQKIMNANQYMMPLYHQVAFIYTSDQLDTKGLTHGNDQFSYEKNILDWETKRDGGVMYTNGGPVEFFEIPTVNPGLYIYQELVFDRLINADSALNPADGMLAESYTVADDQMSIEFIMRDGVTWHDGEPLTAEDVKFTLELYAKTPTMNAVAAGTIASIKGAAEFSAGTADEISGIAIDGNKITIEFAQIAPNMLPVFSQWPILPKHCLEGVAPETLQQDPYWQAPIGSGPFKVGEVVLNNYSTLERYDGYYKQGSGNIQTIHMHASQENDANLIKNAGGGLIDYAWGKNTDEATAIEAMDSMTTESANIRYTRLFYFNMYPHEANIK